MSRGGARVWGNDHPAAQLTEKKVIRYRTLVRTGKATVGELAAKEGCSHGRISMAVRGETWQHLNDVAPPVPAVQRRTAAKAVAKSTAVKKGAAKKATANKIVSKTLAKRTLAKRTLAKRTVAKRPAAKKTVAKKTVAKKATARR